MKIIRLGALGLTLTLAFTSTAWAVPLYTTNFPANENPISEGGAWYHISPLWADVRTFGGEAFGTQAGNLANPQAFNDANASLTGFSPNVTTTGTIFFNVPEGDSSSHTHELELLFRMSGDATNTRAYEVNFDTGGNATLIRWNGGLGDYTFISPTFSASPSLGRLLQTGDTFMAQASGDRFQAWVNGQLVLTAFDSTYATGDPGIGFFIRDDVAADQTFQSLYGLTSLTVVDDGTSTDPNGPGTGPVTDPDPPLAPTPEPATLALMGVSLAVTGWYAGRRRSTGVR